MQDSNIPAIVAKMKYLIAVNPMRVAFFIAYNVEFENPIFPTVSLREFKIPYGVDHVQIIF